MDKAPYTPYIITIVNFPWETLNACDMTNDQMANDAFNLRSVEREKERERERDREIKARVS